MILQPTSPLRKITDIKKSYFYFIKSNADTLLVSIVLMIIILQRMYEKLKNKLLKPLDTKNL